MVISSSNGMYTGITGQPLLCWLMAVLSSSLLWKFFKFSLVGTLGLVIDFGITYLLKEKLLYNKYVANAVGFVCAVTNNFYFNKTWTFDNRNTDVWQQYIIYVGIALVGLVINQWMLYILHYQRKMAFYHSKVIVTLCVVVWNFLINYIITFDS